MEIRYYDPLARGFARMKQALFRPFDLRKWLVVGFTAFLAGLTDCHGGNNGSRSGGHVDWDDVIYFPRHAQEWLLDNPHWFGLIIAGLVVLFVVVVVCTWLSARGRFMFLDNVVHDRAEVARPWHEYRTQGNSLFLFNGVAGILVLVLIVTYLVSCYTSLVEIYERAYEPIELLGPGILMVLGLLLLILAGVLVDLLLIDFVVPIMYKRRIKVLAGWGVFLPLLKTNTLAFVVYALLVALISILVAIGIFLAVVFTCCLGLILLVIPYVNSVVLLPISYTMRAFSVEFLEQFGPEFALYSREGGSGTP